MATIQDVARQAGVGVGTVSRVINESSLVSEATRTRVQQVIDERLENAPDDSYVAGLAAKGRGRIAQKVGEEGVEFALAAAAGDRDEIVEEGADLLFHMTIALRDHDLSLSDVVACLEGVPDRGRGREGDGGRPIRYRSRKGRASAKGLSAVVDAGEGSRPARAFKE